MAAKRKRRTKRQEAVTPLSAPTPWRLQHGDFHAPRVEPDPDTGTPVSLRRAVTLLDRMVASGTITPAMRQAGDDFHRSFRVASLDPLRAAPFMRVPRTSGDTTTERIEAARGRIGKAMAVLGGSDSPAGSCIWHVVGCEASIREWAARCGWGGRSMGHAQAQGVLVGALGVLAAHYGLERPAKVGAMTTTPAAARSAASSSNMSVKSEVR
jgi:hypothetical protein